MNKKDYKRLGDYIREVDVRNKDLKVSNLLGVSITKEFIPSIANTIGTDMSSYKIIHKGQFAYGPVTSRNGEKVSIALLNDDLAIISQAYTVFEVIDENNLLPQYLMMWFKRPEFDRYARFKSHGSAREIFDWEEMCNVYLPIPSIEKQREIVYNYETLTKRIQHNENMIQKLEDTGLAIYHKMFVDGIDTENLPKGWREGFISDVGTIITGKTPSSDNPEDFGNELQFITPGDFHDYNKYIMKSARYLSYNGYTKLKNKILPINSILVTCIGSDMGKIAITSRQCITNQQINSIVVKNIFLSDYLYYYLNSIRKDLKAMALGSSTLPLLNKSEFNKIKVIIPDDGSLNKFHILIGKINYILKLYIKENFIIKNMQFLLLINIRHNN